MNEIQGESFRLIHGDCVEATMQMPPDSVDFTIYSPPFSSLYTFSDDPRDMSNCRTDAEFWEHYKFLIEQSFRITKPGRLVSVHCMPLPTSKLRDGFIGVRDFPGEIIHAHEAAGFHFHSEVVIRKDPVAAMQRTKAIGLLHKQVAKDSTLSRMALADYVVTLRKPGENAAPVGGEFDAYYGNETDPAGALSMEDNYNGRQMLKPGEPRYSIAVWQRYAEPVWLDINQGDVLSHHEARDDKDERHIAPLQLTVIRRCVDLWSNPGDVVFSPFAGIGSEGYVALQMGRKFLGTELKDTYFKQARQNLRLVENAPPLALSSVA
jgi:DNA modification methylase